MYQIELGHWPRFSFKRSCAIAIKMAQDRPSTSLTAPPREVMVDFGVSKARFLQETAIARIWRVERAGGDPAALKVYLSDSMGNETYGFAFLRALKGASAVHIYAQSQTAALMEWLPGPSLGDLSRSGRDKDAAFQLGSVASVLHGASGFDASKWPELSAWFAPLFDMEFALNCTADDRALIEHGRDVARQRLAASTNQVPLHGDLHHDNVRLGPRGYCSFDAKGVVGDRAYELANAFRNPKGVPDLIRDPARLRFLRDTWSDALGIEAQDLMGWAVAKTALSIAWRSKGVLSSDPELDLLDLMLGVLDAG